QCSGDKNAFAIQIKQLRIDNDQFLKQIMSQEIMHIAVNSVDICDVNKSCVNKCSKCLELETELLKKKDLIEKDDNVRENQNAQSQEINELKAQSQERTRFIRKLKDRIKSLSGKDSVENVKKDIDEIETINIVLEHSKTFTVVRNKSPLTRFTSTKVVPTKETTNKSVLTPTQGIIVYSRRSKAPKLVGLSSKYKITKSRISNSSDPTQSGGSTVSDVPSSSLNDCRLSKLFYGVWTPDSPSI
ncbi:hypothetical protein Tco_1481442, partial [Tanacetum coccineum]